MWVHTNTPTWELIGDDNGLTWVNTNTPTWERICTVTWVYTNTHTRELNRYRPDQTRQTDRHTLIFPEYRIPQYISTFLRLYSGKI